MSEPSPAPERRDDERPDLVARRFLTLGVPISIAAVTPVLVVFSDEGDAATAALLGLGLLAVHALASLLGARLPDGARLVGDVVRHASGAVILYLGPGLLGGATPVWLLGIPAAAALALTTQRVVVALFTLLALALAAALGMLAVGVAPLATVPAALTILLSGALGGVLTAHVMRAGASLFDAIDRMQSEAVQRSQTERDLRMAQEDLERHVEERTIALTRANRALQREVQERRVAEEQALEASRIKSSFLQNISHELRTPLNAIIGYSEMMLEDVDELDPARAREDLDHIKYSATNLLGIVSGVLDLEKIEAGKMETKMETFPISELLDYLAKTTAPLARKNGNTLKLKHARELGMITTDRAKLNKILLNLLSNACKFTHDGRIELRVGLTVEQQRPWLVFSVVDTGIGIPAHLLDRLFMPFTQADESPTREYGGTGIGLAIAKHFCELLGADISVESTPGEGSTFSVTIPREPLDLRNDGLVLVSLY